MDSSESRLAGYNMFDGDCGPWTISKYKVGLCNFFEKTHGWLDDIQQGRLENGAAKILAAAMCCSGDKCHSLAEEPAYADHRGDLLILATRLEKIGEEATMLGQSV